MPKKIVAFLTICVASLSFSTGVNAQDSDNYYVDQSIAYDKNLTGYDYPFAISEYNFRSQGQDLRMAYMYLPAKDADKGVVTLLHGKNFNGAYWKSTADLLQGMGYGVLIPDQIGFGKSTKTTDYQYSFAALAKNTKSLIDSLSIKKTIIVGHSMGGMLASRFTLLYPEVTEKLILVNPIGLEDYLKYSEYKDVSFFYENELKKKPINIINYQIKNYYDGEWNEQYAALTKPLIGWINGDDYDLLSMVSALTYDMIFTGPVINEFDNIQVPTTLIIGTRDRTGPGRGWKKDGVDRELGRYDQLGKEIKRINPEINVIELDGLGHLPQIESFKRFSTVFKTAIDK